MTTNNKTLALDVLNEMERASERLFDAGLHRDLSLDVARDAVAELIEAAESIADHYDMDGYGATAWKSLALEMADKARTALARVKGESA